MVFIEMAIASLLVYGTSTQHLAQHQNVYIKKGRMGKHTKVLVL